MDVYELSITVHGGESSYRVEHRFPMLPAAHTIVALKREATDLFSALYEDQAVDGTYVYVMYLAADERNQPDRTMAQAHP